MRLTLLFAAMITSLSGSAAVAQEKLDHRGKVLGWEAIGRLDLGDGYCTGTLIAADLVLTAAHCVVDKPKRALTDTARMTFRAGYYGTASIAERSVSAVFVPPAYLEALASGDITQRIGQDVALVRLGSAISTTDADPYILTQEDAAPTRISLVSYGRGRDDALTREAACALTQRYRGGVMSFDCDATFGSSGAPLFAKEGNRLRIFSIVSSGRTRDDGRLETYGMELAAVVTELKAQMRMAQAIAPVSAGVKRLKVGERAMGSGGARFVTVPGS